MVSVMDNKTKLVIKKMIENEISKEIIAESFNIALESVEEIDKENVKPKQISPEEIVTINQMYDQGKTPLNIANALGRTRTAIYFHLHKRKDYVPKISKPLSKEMKIKVAKMFKDNISTKEISEKLNVSIVQVRDEVRKLRLPEEVQKHRRLTEEQRQKIFELLKQGKPAEKIAEETNADISTVYRHRNKYISKGLL